MAQNTDITLVADTWTQLTNADVTAITFQNKGPLPIKVKATTGATAPADDAGALVYESERGEVDMAMADLFPGIAGVRLWALARKSVRVAVSHA